MTQDACLHSDVPQEMSAGKTLATGLNYRSDCTNLNEVLMNARERTSIRSLPSHEKAA